MDTSGRIRKAAMAMVAVATVGVLTGGAALAFRPGFPAAGAGDAKAKTRETRGGGVAKAPTALPHPPLPGSAKAEMERGAAWLLAQQHPSGGFSQGDESQAMGGGVELRDVPNVADTCMAGLALVHSGSTPARGPHAAHVRRAVEFVCGEVERAPVQGLSITSVTGTRVQAKLGSSVDTFSAALFLAEVKDSMPDAASRRRVEAALAKVMDKIQKHQSADGTWARDGWAPSLSQGMAAKAVNKAALAGVKVDEQVRLRAEKFAQAQYDAERGFVAGGAEAGVELYGAGSAISGIQASADANEELEKDARDVLARPNAPPAERQKALGDLKRVDENKAALREARTALVRKMNDAEFVSGFGSNGGEEFLSYLSIGESLRAGGGDEWRGWYRSMSGNLRRIQNPDGSWSGHHCITGRTFCTSAALLILALENEARPVSGSLRG